MELMTGFHGVFEQPRGFLRILTTRKEDNNPVGVRPYRYLKIQKDEIERLSREMLDAIIKRLSTIPFSSSMLLVKKKKGLWCFCVYHCALNKET